MEKNYTAVITQRTPRPRSKRLRKMGIGSAAGATVVMIGASGGTTVMGDGHTHANKSALDQISTDSQVYEYLTRLVEVEVENTDKETGETTTSTEWQSKKEKVKAGYADIANDLTEDSPVRQQFLSRIADDVAQGKITFEQGLIAVGMAIFQDGAEFGEFVKSLYAGKGAGIDKDGNAEFESVRVRTYFEAVELIINRLSAIEGDQILTEADTIERVVDLGDNCYGLYLHPKWEGYFTAQAVGSVLKGIINNLGAIAMGKPGQGDVAMYTSWMRVNSVNAASNYIEVTLYPDEETPAMRNFPPCELMKIARWGSQTDPKRQSCLYLSSTDGRIVHLSGVTKPIIDTTNYASTFGTMPDFIKQLTDRDGNPLPLRDNLDYAYIGGLVVQDVIRIDFKGKPIVTYVDRGQWYAAANYYCEAKNPTTGVWETSDVWYMGCKWRCCKNLTKTEPRWNNTDWAMVEGNPDFTVEFADTDYLFDPDRFAVTLTIIAKLHNIDVTADILDADVIWTRYSEDADGNERVASDNAWALKRAGAGKSINLTADDVDFNGYVPKVLRYTATVTLRDGMGEETATEQTTFEF